MGISGAEQLGSLRRRVIAWLAAALLVIYWGVGLPVSLLYINYDRLQLLWILIPYVWEVPVLGCLLVLLPTWIGLSPVAAFIERVRHRGSEDDLAGLMVPQSFTTAAEAARRAALSFPLRLPRIVLLASVIGFGLGSVQARVFGEYPWAEV